jgi:hypothetical protein
VLKLVDVEAAGTLVICGYVHFDSLVTKLRALEHTVDQRVYLETVPEIQKVRTKQQ